MKNHWLIPLTITFLIFGCSKRKNNDQAVATTPEITTEFKKLFDEKEVEIGDCYKYTSDLETQVSKPGQTISRETLMRNYESDEKCQATQTVTETLVRVTSEQMDFRKKSELSTTSECSNKTEREPVIILNKLKIERQSQNSAEDSSLNKCFIGMFQNKKAVRIERSSSESNSTTISEIKISGNPEWLSVNFKEIKEAGKIKLIEATDIMEETIYDASEIDRLTVSDENIIILNKALSNSDDLELDEDVQEDEEIIIEQDNSTEDSDEDSEEETRSPHTA